MAMPSDTMLKPVGGCEPRPVEEVGHAVAARRDASRLAAERRRSGRARNSRPAARARRGSGRRCRSSHGRHDRRGAVLARRRVAAIGSRSPAASARPSRPPSPERVCVAREPSTGGTSIGRATATIAPGARARRRGCESVAPGSSASRTAAGSGLPVERDVETRRRRRRSAAARPPRSARCRRARPRSRSASGAAPDGAVGGRHGEAVHRARAGHAKAQIAAAAAVLDRDAGARRKDAQRRAHGSFASGDDLAGCGARVERREGRAIDRLEAHASPTATRNCGSRAGANMRSGVRPTSHQPVGIAKVVISASRPPIMTVPGGCGGPDRDAAGDRKLRRQAAEVAEARQRSRTCRRGRWRRHAARPRAPASGRSFSAICAMSSPNSGS